MELLGPILYPGSEKIAIWPKSISESQVSASIRGETDVRSGISINGAGTETGAEPSKKSIKGEYVVVRMLRDLPTFTGADGRNYIVSAEDVVVLPQLNATGLIKRNAAKLITDQ